MSLALKAGALALGCFTLAGCATPGGLPATVPTARSAFDAACRNEPLAYAAFALATSIRPVSARTVRAVDAAHAEAVRICANPPADLASGVVAITRAYVTVRDARDAASKRAKA